MGTLLAALAALGKIIPFFQRLLSIFEKKEQQAHGRDQAELAGRKIIEEIGNEQDERAASPLSDDDVARRLRDRTG